MTRWQQFEEEAIKALHYKSDKDIAAHLTEKGYLRNAGQVAGKRVRMGLYKYSKPSGRNELDGLA